MIYPSADILEKWGSKYSLVVLAARRAKQIKSGAPPLIETRSRNPLTIALEEIAAGKVQCQVADHDILPKTSQEVEVAQLLAIPTLSVDDEATAEAIAAFSDETELIAEDEEEMEEEEEEDDLLHKSFDEDEEEEHEEEEEEEEAHFVDDVEDEVKEEPIQEPSIADEAPGKPKRSRKKKAEEDEVVPLDDPDALFGGDPEDSDDD